MNTLIPYVDLGKQWTIEKKFLLKLIDRTMSEGDWVGGKEIEKFENNIKKICKTKYAIALNSGTDALTLGLYMLGIRKGDEVITTPNSFIASAATIAHLGAVPKFVDVLPDQNINPELIVKSITKKTKAIMPVHLTGRISEMKKIMQISKKYNIPVIEDGAQSIGSKYMNKPSGSFGDIGCFSAHPLKNLNAMGDAGYLVTNNKKINDKIKDLRNHGMNSRNKIKHFGHVSRMDNLQAAILNYRLKNLNTIIKKRRFNANFYKKNLNSKNVFVPEEKIYEFNSYHTFVVQVKKRDQLRLYLKKNNIITAIHYPTPIHLQPACKKYNYKKGDFIETEKQAKSILTLPINQFLSLKNLDYIVNKINKFYE
jgi:dTDP-4-amino-4,6-dideoxygalactose transaminase